jgi:RNA ligase (TIGR02306 family)
MSIRKLASIRKISRIEPIEGADRIVKAHVDGWTLVTAKENGFMANDLVCYCEIDSFLPVEERYEFLRKSSFKSTKNLGDGFRIKTIKLKGTISQGLLLPLSRGFDKDDLPCLTIVGADGVAHPVYEGDDVTELLGIKLYEKPVPASLSGSVKGNFPVLIRKTDQERIQNVYKEIAYDLNALWEVTLKLDGSSMTVYKKGSDYGVCSRNIDLLEDNTNLFWTTARKLRLIEALEWLGKNYAFQGELMGPGVQGNREWLKTNTFFLFDIWDIDNQRYLSPEERGRIVDSLNNSGFEMPVVYSFGNKALKEFGTDPEVILSNILNYAEGKSIYNPVREGVVFKRLDGQLSFKAISQSYLLEEK